MNVEWFVVRRSLFVVRSGSPTTERAQANRFSVATPLGAW
jgi:hypothetical protein